MVTSSRQLNSYDIKADERSLAARALIWRLTELPQHFIPIPDPDWPNVSAHQTTHEPE
jgi:hypothetical protein